MIERTWLLPRATTSTNNVANVIPRAIGTRANISKRRRRNMFMVAACHRSFETTQSAKQRNARFAKPLAASFKTLTTPPSNPPNLGWLLRGHAPQPRMMGPLRHTGKGQAAASCRLSRAWLPSWRLASLPAPRIAATGVVKD